MGKNLENIAFVASDSPYAKEALSKLTRRYGNSPLDEADVIVALGGDGFMLQTLHRHMRLGLPLFGMKRGTVGFLMNAYREEHLRERLQNAEVARLHPLRMRAQRNGGDVAEALAMNEVSLLRQTRLAARIRVLVNERERLPELVCDGIMVATPAGSTAYNLSVNGPILPLDAGVLALTPISPFRPRRWHGAILPRDVRVRLEIIEPHRRPVSATADAEEIRDVTRVDIAEVRDITLQLMFDPEHNLEERIMGEQFLP